MPPKRHSNQPDSRVRAFRRTTVYIMDDVARGLGAARRPNYPAAWRHHEENCDEMHTLLDTRCPDAVVKSVGFSAGQNESQFTEYWAAEIRAAGANHLFIIYVHSPPGKAVGNGEDYQWNFCPIHPGPKTINTRNFFRQLYASRVHCLLLIDGDMPTRFEESLKRKNFMFEIIQSGKIFHAVNGSVARDDRNLTPYIGRQLTNFSHHPTGNSKKTIPELMKNARLANNSNRTWTNKTANESQEIVDRIVLDPAAVGLDGGLKFYTVRLQGPDINKIDKDCLYLLDGFMPTRYPTKFGRAKDITEFIHSGKDKQRPDGILVHGSANFFEALAVTLDSCHKEINGEHALWVEPMTFPELMADRRNLCSNPLRKFTKKTKKFSKKEVRRLAVDPFIVREDGFLSLVSIQI